MPSLTLLVCLLLALCLDPAVAPAPGVGELVLRNVTVIDVTASDLASARIPAQTVVLFGEKIERLGPLEQVPVPAGATVVDGTGKYLIPGLWDMHAHVSADDEAVEKVLLPLLLAHGVTGLRELSGDCWEPCSGTRKDIRAMRAMQARIERFELLGPRILALSSAVVRGPAGRERNASLAFYPPRTRGEGECLVAYVQGRGVDLIKVYHGMPREAFFGLMQAANAIGLPVAGHLPRAVHPIEAARAGMRSLEHARFPAYACAPGYEALREAWDRYSRGELESVDAEFEALQRRVVEEFDEELAQAIFAALVENDTWLVPTHITRKMDAFASDAGYRADPRRKYLPGLVLADWDGDLERTADTSPERIRFFQEFFELGLRVTGMAHAAGVKILLGTDTPDTMAFPGLGVHEELGYLVRAGLTPLDALRAGTLLPAEFLGLEARFGSITAGKAGDVILLAGDPLEDIANSGRIEAVVYRGELLEREALDAMLADVLAYAAQR